MADSRDLGRRVAYWRNRRGMTRRHFADLVGRSLSWVEKIEQGDRELTRLPMLERVADALQISLRTLIDEAEAEEAQRSPDPIEVAAIKKALGAYGALVGKAPAPKSADLDQLRRQVEYVHEAFLASDFAIVGRMLPRVIVDGQRAVDVHEGNARKRAAALLAKVYKTTSSTLHKFGSHDLAWLAADRAIVAAALADDPVSLARATRCAGRALMSVGQRQEAIDLLMGVAARLEPDLDQAEPELLALVGMMWLAAEIAAAREGDADTALMMHHNAEAIVVRLGVGHDDPSTAFGATNVALHRLAALVRLGDGPAALSFAQTINDDASTGYRASERQTSCSISPRLTGSAVTTPRRSPLSGRQGKPLRKNSAARWHAK